MNNFSTETIDSICEKYNQNVSQRDIAARFHIGLPTLKKILVDRGFTGGWRDRYPLNEQCFNELTDSAAYWVGFIMADGNVSAKGKVGIKLSEIDEMHLHSYRTFVGAKNHRIYHHVEDIRLPQGTHGTFSSRSIQFHSRTIADALATYGVVPNKSKIAQFTDLAAHNKFCWLGLVDGDGSLGWARKCPRFFLSGSENILRQFNEFVVERALGLRGVKVLLYPNKVPQLHLYGDRCKAVVRYLWEGHSLGIERKRRIAMEILNA